MSKYIGATVVNLSVDTVDVTGDITATDSTPELILLNDTHEDTEGGREGKITFKGEQSGGEVTVLGQIQSSHDGTSDDQKGDLIFKTNDGSDGTSPTERLRIDSNGSILTATLGTDNVHLGEGAGNSIASGGNQNTLIGKDAGTALTTGDANVIVGHGAGDALTDADYNVALGFGALGADTKGDRSVAIGLNALQAQNHTSATQTYNTAVGDNAGYATTTGVGNTFIGALSGDAVTTGGLNTFVGTGAGSATDDGASNTAVGAYALDAGNCGDNNTAIGAGALGDSSHTGADNTAVGKDAGNALESGTDNTFLGRQAGLATTTGSSNTYIGPGAAGTCTTASNNTIIGGFNGNQNSLDTRTYSNNIILSDGAGNVGLFIEDADGYARGRMGANPQTTYNAAALKVERNVSDHVTSIQTYVASATNRYAIIFGNSNASNVGNITTDGSATAYNTSSDYRLKENVADITDGITRVKQLAPKRFNFIADADKTVDGFLAHEAATVVPEAVSGEKDAVNDDGNIEPQGIDQSKLVPLLTAALQEAIAKIETLETKVAALEGE